MALFKGKTNRKKAITYGPFFKEKLGGIQIGGKSIKMRRGNDKCKFLGFLTLWNFDSDLIIDYWIGRSKFARLNEAVVY